MKRLARSLIFTLIASQVVACIAVGPKYSVATKPEDGHGVVYIYRPNAFAKGGTAPYVFLNQQRCSMLKNGGYQRHEVRPGPNLIEFDANFLIWDFDKIGGIFEVEAGQHIFVRFDLLFVAINPIFSTIRAEVRKIAEAAAIPEIQRTRLSGAPCRNDTQ